MKKIASLILIAITVTTLFAQSPDKFSYQAVIRNAENKLVTEKMVGMQISILQGSVDGLAVYSEIQTPTSNTNGLVSIEIGSGTSSDNITSINWADGPYFIKTEIDPTGGTNYSIIGTSQLLSVPYAQYAEKAGSVNITGNEDAFDGWDKDADPWLKNGTNVYYNGGNVGIGTNTALHPLTIYSGKKAYIIAQNDSTGSAITDGLVMGINSNKIAYVHNYEAGELRLGTKSQTRLTIDENGDVGIGTTSPEAKLQVNGDVKIGSSGINFSELREFTGTTNNTGTSSNRPLPDGYNQGNIRIMSVEIEYATGIWHSQGLKASTGETISYIISHDRLYIYYPDADNYHNSAFRVLLMKVE